MKLNIVLIFRIHHNILWYTPVHPATIHNALHGLCLISYSPSFKQPIFKLVFVRIRTRPQACRHRHGHRHAATDMATGMPSQTRPQACRHRHGHRHAATDMATDMQLQTWLQLSHHSHRHGHRHAATATATPADPDGCRRHHGKCFGSVLLRPYGPVLPCGPYCRTCKVNPAYSCTFCETPCNMQFSAGTLYPDMHLYIKCSILPHVCTLCKCIAATPLLRKK